MVIKEILNRRAVRDYKPDEVPEECITEIIKAGQFAPTGKNTKEVEFIVVKNQETKNKIFEIVDQEFIKEAPVLIIPAADSSKTNLWIQDLSAASENMLLQAAALGLGTVWKNLQPEWEEKVKKLLRVPDKYRAINIIPVGYPKNKVKPHGDTDFTDKKIHKEYW
jgi:nitroreductase